MAGALSRRSVSVPALYLGAVLLTLTGPLWLPVAACADLAMGRRRLPTMRLLCFAVCWAWLEVAGVSVAIALWCVGAARNQRAHYALQRWWAARLMGALARTTGIRVESADTAALSPGPVILLCRHASLADSLLSAWLISTGARMRPRYVLKRELLSDPCLDIVGNRLPNRFIDRGADDATAELAAIGELSAGLGHDDVAVIFPEGTRASAEKRRRALDRLAERNPARAHRLGALRHLLPPRPAGSLALVAGAPTADIVIGWHTGFDGLDTFGGILRHLTSPPPPIRFAAVRHRRAGVPVATSSPDSAFIDWLDDQWLLADAEIERVLNTAAPADTG